MKLCSGSSTPLTCAPGRTLVSVPLFYHECAQVEFTHLLSDFQETLLGSQHVIGSPDTSPTWLYPLLPCFMELWPDPTPSLHVLLAQLQS